MVIKMFCSQWHLEKLVATTEIEYFQDDPTIQGKIFAAK